MKDLVSEEGFATLFRGAGTTIQCVAASNFIYFYTFHGLKKWLSESKPSALTDLLFACLAGACNVMITNPLWVVNSRIKMQGIKILRILCNRLARNMCYLLDIDKALCSCLLL